MILILGNFGFANSDLSGQTIKTRTTYNLFNKYYSDHDQVKYFDTQTLNHKTSIFRMFKDLSSCTTLIYLPAHNNLKYIFPTIFLMSYIFRFDIIYSVIGGWLVHYLKNMPLHRWMLKRIKLIFTETTNTKNGLENNYGFSNVDVLYNFRITDFKPYILSHKELRIVFMARIDPMKGLDVIFSFCKYLQSFSQRPSIIIDFYGPIDPSYNGKFKTEVENFEFTSYKGILEPEQIYSVISNYDLSLLPTHYYTEGLPGTIIESYMSGLPVIVSEWEHAREFVHNRETGIIIPFENNQKIFNDTILELYYDRDLLYNLKMNAIKFSYQFSAEYAWSKYNTLIK